MKYGVYSIFDSAAGVFTAPTVDISDASAVRAFQHAIANKDTFMYIKPDDFSLYKVGTFDVETGCLESLSPISRLVVGTNDYNKESVDE